MYFATLGAILIDIFSVMVMEKKCLKKISPAMSKNLKKNYNFFQVMTNIKSVDTKLSEQIKYLTQVSTGHPHEGSSYPSQKVLQSAWHRLEHVKTRITELDRLRQQGVAITPTQKQQLVQVRNVWVFSPLVPSKREKNMYISFAQLVLLSLYIFRRKCVYFSIFD